MGFLGGRVVTELAPLGIQSVEPIVEPAPVFEGECCPSWGDEPSEDIEEKL